MKKWMGIIVLVVITGAVLLLTRHSGAEQTLTERQMIAVLGSGSCSSCPCKDDHTIICPDQDEEETFPACSNLTPPAFAWFGVGAQYRICEDGGGGECRKAGEPICWRKYQWWTMSAISPYQCASETSCTPSPGTCYLGNFIITQETKTADDCYCAFQ